MFIFLGAKYTIDAVVFIANTLNIGKEVIALSAVSLGTSLPEVIVTITAALKGIPEMAVGNIIGSNIFNIAFVLGATSIIKKIDVSSQLIFSDGFVMLGFSLLFLVFAITKKKISRKEGFVLFALYIS